jgi:hypothetical protein
VRLGSKEYREIPEFRGKPESKVILGSKVYRAILELRAKQVSKVTQAFREKLARPGALLVKQAFRV